MSRPLVSCIVPVCNGDRFLSETIDSILAQTYTPIELIVVDDGSTDGTAGVAQGYGARLRYVVQENGGIGSARNAGIREAAGAFVGFLDADDLWVETKIEKQMARFDARPELDLSLAAFQNFWMPEAAADEARFRHHRIAQPFAGYVVPTLLARRSAFDRFGFFDPSLRHAPGAPWVVQAFQKGANIEIVPEVLMRRRLHRRNMSKTTPVPCMEALLHVIKGKLDVERHGGRLPTAAPIAPSPRS